MFFVFSVPKIFPVPKTYKTVSKEVRSAVRRFPWNQLNLSGSRKADTVGCDGTHFIQSSDLIQLLKSSLTAQHLHCSYHPELLNTEFPDRPGVQ